MSYVDPPPELPHPFDYFRLTQREREAWPKLTALQRACLLGTIVKDRSPPLSMAHEAGPVNFYSCMFIAACWMGRDLDPIFEQLKAQRLIVV